MNARAWFYSRSFNGRTAFPGGMVGTSNVPRFNQANRRYVEESNKWQALYCVPCDIEHDTPEQCPEHDDYEPVRGLDRYPDVNVSDLADND